MEAVSEIISAGESYYAGWPGGHCLRVPKEQEGLFRRLCPVLPLPGYSQAGNHFLSLSDPAKRSFTEEIAEVAEYMGARSGAHILFSANSVVSAVNGSFATSSGNPTNKLRRRK